jgi:hypothetical protein
MLSRVKNRLLSVGLFSCLATCASSLAMGAEWQELPKTFDPRLEDVMTSRERVDLQKFQAYALDASGHNWARLPQLSQLPTNTNVLNGDNSIVADVAKVREIQITLAGDAFTQNYSKALRAIENLELRLFAAHDPDERQDLEDLLDGWRATLLRQQKLFFARVDQVTPDVRRFYFNQLKSIFDRRGISTADIESEEFRNQTLAYIQILYTQNSFQLRIPLQLTYGSLEATWYKYVAALTELSWTYPRVESLIVETTGSEANPFRKGTVESGGNGNEYTIVLDMSVNGLLDSIKTDLNFAYPVKVRGSVPLTTETKEDTTLLTGVCLRAEKTTDGILVKTCS